ncbi:hypothetical protein CC1G_13290 [Coprinopsis cinerea okayama7|uniref:Uncharacterized protein n=1 Tax=Coprinopsis cinerea (strain Okayama-7 / 130 / ATCC MYA-4618 / FGSC 9003) TaxID=240176 RepID=A8MZS8_COPC7|nr:hypothetical protein CC1G_13290 [Coprinopsis cinerea okayama7\|eukprot:XP_001828140.1 hypothetical protein CC1G_13290 [Coprinopsis cinerea okayama7\
MRAVFTREQATALGLQVPQDRPQDLPGPTFVPRRVRNGTNYSWNRTTTNPIVLRYDELLASPLFQESRSWLGQGQLFNASHTIYQLNLELGRPTERPYLPLVVASVIDVGDGVSVIDYATNGALSETQPFPTTVFSPARPVIRSISAHRRDASKASEKAVEPLSGTQVTPRTGTAQADTGPKQGASSSGAHSSGASPKTPKSMITKSTKAPILQQPSESVGILEDQQGSPSAGVLPSTPLLERRLDPLTAAAGLLHANLPLEPAEGSVVPAPNFDPTKVAAEFPRTADLKTHVPGVPRGLRQEDGEYRPPPSSSFQAFPTTEDFARQTEEIARARAETPLEDRIDLKSGDTLHHLSAAQRRRVYPDRREPHPRQRLENARTTLLVAMGLYQKACDAVREANRLHRKKQRETAARAGRNLSSDKNKRKKVNEKARKVQLKGQKEVEKALTSDDEVFDPAPFPPPNIPELEGLERETLQELIRQLPVSGDVFGPDPTGSGSSSSSSSDSDASASHPPVKAKKTRSKRRKAHRRLLPTSMRPDYDLHPALARNITGVMGSRRFLTDHVLQIGPCLRCALTFNPNCTYLGPNRRCGPCGKGGKPCSFDMRPLELRGLRNHAAAVAEGSSFYLDTLVRDILHQANVVRLDLNQYFLAVLHLAELQARLLSSIHRLSLTDGPQYVVDEHFDGDFEKYLQFREMFIFDHQFEGIDGNIVTHAELVAQMDQIFVQAVQARGGEAPSIPLDSPRPITTPGAPFVFGAYSFNDLPSYDTSRGPTAVPASDAPSASRTRKPGKSSTKSDGKTTGSSKDTASLKKKGKQKASAQETELQEALGDEYDSLDREKQAVAFQFFAANPVLPEAPSSTIPAPDIDDDSADMYVDDIEMVVGQESRIPSEEVPLPPAVVPTADTPFLGVAIPPPSSLAGPSSFVPTEVAIRGRTLKRRAPSDSKASKSKRGRK